MQNWKRIVYTMAAIQIGTGISIIGVVAFIPLFLTSELGVTDPGEAAFWAGLISGVTPFFVAIAAPFWSMQADRRGPHFALSMILFILGVVIALMYFTRSPVELLILRMIQGMSGGFVAVGMSLVMNVTPKKQLTWAMGVFQASMVMGIMFGPLVGGMIADTLGYRMPFVIFCALSFFCLAAVRLMVPKQIGQEPARERESFAKQLSYFMKNPVVRLMVMLQFLCNCGMTGIGPILPLYIKEMMGGDAMAVATIVGIIIFIAGATSVTSSLNVSRLAKRISMPRILIIASCDRRELHSPVPDAGGLDAGLHARAHRLLPRDDHAAGQYHPCHGGASGKAYDGGGLLDQFRSYGQCRRPHGVGRHRHAVGLWYGLLVDSLLLFPRCMRDL